MRLALVAILFATPSALAFSVSKPERHDVFSHNRAFVLDVNPDTKTHTVYDVRDRTKPLWSFSCPVGLYQDPFLLSDDGQVVATIAARYISVERVANAKAVTFWNKGGEFRSHGLRDLCPDPPKTWDVGGGPIGDFWRTWYTEVEAHGGSFSIYTTRGVECRFQFADGELVDRSYFGLRKWIIWVSLMAGAVAVVAGVTIVYKWWRRSKQSSPDPTWPASNA